MKLLIKYLDKKVKIIKGLFLSYYIINKNLTHKKKENYLN